MKKKKGFRIEAQQLEEEATWCKQEVLCREEDRCREEEKCCEEEKEEQCW